MGHKIREVRKEAVGMSKTGLARWALRRCKMNHLEPQGLGKGQSKITIHIQYLKCIEYVSACHS